MKCIYLGWFLSIGSEVLISEPASFEGVVSVHLFLDAVSLLMAMWEALDQLELISGVFPWYR